jgi:hypothetical protein
VRRPVLAALTTTLLAAGLSGCGGDRFDAYCASVKSHRDELTKTLDAGGSEALLKALPTFEELREDAPSDIEDDWTILTDALGELEDALDAAGVDWSTYDASKPPAGVTQAEQDRIAAAATEVGSDRTQEALDAVDQQARDVCHAPLTV